MSLTPPPAQPSPVPEMFGRLFTKPETLITVNARDYTKKDGDSDQPSKYDEM